MTTSKKTPPLYRLSAFIVFIALTSLTAAGFFVTRSAAQGAERKLLHERAAEVAAIVTSSSRR